MQTMSSERLSPDAYFNWIRNVLPSLPGKRGAYAVNTQSVPYSQLLTIQTINIFPSHLTNQLAVDTPHA
jgi:hypothetical protein